MDEVRLGSRTLQPRRQLLVAGCREPIGKRALDILSVLAEARGAIVTKDELLEAVWPGVVVEENALQVHVVALRKALGPEADRLRTIRGVGYQLETDRQAAPDVGVIPRSLPGDRPPSGGQEAPRLSVTVEALRTWTGSHRLALSLAALVLVLAGGWLLLGDNLGLRPQQRIPVVVRDLTATATGNQTEAALASGITDELVLRLRRIPELKIGTANPDGSIENGDFARGYVVDGNIRSSGEQLRVTARLLSPDGEVLWSQTFDRRLIDIFEVQETIAASIADALSVSFDVGGSATEYGGTNNPEAYAAYLQSQGLNDFRAQERYLERALALDPNYIKALNQLAVSYGLQANVAPTRQEALALMQRFDDITARAIEANPDLWIGHVARGWYYSNRRDFMAAYRSFRRAAELDDGRDPELRSQLAGWALVNGRTEEAAATDASIEIIDPTRRRERNWLLFQQGKLKEAIAEHERLAAGNAPGLSARFQVFWSYVLLGDENAGVTYFEQAQTGAGEAYLGQKSEVGRLGDGKSLAELRAWASGRFGEGGLFDLTTLAVVASNEGHSQLAVNLLRLALERPAGGYPVLVMWWPPMANARKTDAFEQLVADIGLVKLWRETGDWPDACRPVSATEISCH